MKVFLKNNKIDAFIVIWLLLFFGILNLIVVNSLDEIWKYDHAKAIMDGYIMYKDVNLLVTPLYFLIVSLFLRINSTLVGFRVMSIVMWTITMFIGYKIIEKNKSKEIATLGITQIILIIFALGNNVGQFYLFDYNFLLLTLSLCLVYLLLKDDLNIKHYILLGNIAAFCDLTKQSIGLFIAIVTFCYIVYLNKKNKENIFYFSFGFLVPNLLFLLYLIKMNIIKEFFDLCLFGMSSFKDNSITIQEYWVDKTSEKLLLIMVLFFLSYQVYLIFKNKTSRYVYELIIGLLLFLETYPLFDDAHILAIFVFAPILFFANNDLKFEKVLKKNTKIFCIYMCVTFVLLFPICQYIYNINHSLGLIKSNQQNIKDFYIEESSENIVNQINSYIDNHSYDKYIILSPIASLISVSRDEYGGIYDIFLNGNLGTHSPMEYIEDSTNKGCKIIMQKNYTFSNRQNFKNIENYIQTNYKQIDTIGNNFIVYEK